MTNLNLVSSSGTSYQTHLTDDDYDQEQLHDEETIFLGVAVGIMSIVIFLALAAVIYVIMSIWKLKYYTHFYTDTESSLESSLKR